MFIILSLQMQIVERDCTTSIEFRVASAKLNWFFGELYDNMRLAVAGFLKAYQINTSLKSKINVTYPDIIC